MSGWGVGETEIGQRRKNREDEEEKEREEDDEEEKKASREFSDPLCFKLHLHQSFCEG